MSSAVVSTSAALGRPFLFDAESEAEVFPVSSEKKPSSQSLTSQVFQSRSKNQSAIPLVTPASHLEIRPAPEMVTSGIAALDALTGGLPRGCLTEICGSASSGRTSVMLAALAAATRRGEYCSVIDASDTLDPHSVAASGIELDRLLWVRCDENSPRRHRGTEKNTQRARPISSSAPETGKLRKAAFDFNGTTTFRHSEHRLEQLLRAIDLLLESGGFGLIVLDLADIPPHAARRIPLTTWFRFRRAVEHKTTILLAIEQQPIAGSCSSLLVRVAGSRLSVLSSNQSSAAPDADHRTADLKPFHSNLLTELKINAEVIRSRFDRKPARSIAFETKTAWAG